MKRAELVQRLRDTAEIMAGSADALSLYGKTDEAVQHAEELACAAEIVGELADELEKDEA